MNLGQFVLKTNPADTDFFVGYQPAGAGVAVEIRTPMANIKAMVIGALVAADIPPLTAAKITDFDAQVRLSRIDQMAAPTAAVSMNSQRITNLLNPSAAQDAATKAYVDAAGYQPLSSNLTLYAAITPSANTQSFLGAANYAAMRTQLGAAVASGLATLDAGGKIPTSQIPDSVLGQVEYQGSYNASTNTPTLSASPGATTKGDYYVVSVAGTFDSVGYAVGDWIISNGTIWQKVDNTDLVTMVAGRTGAITLTTADIGGLGTIATQAASAVAITGGAINGTTIGATTPSTGAFTTLTATGTINAAQTFLLGSAAPAADTTTLLTFQGSNLQRNWRLGVNVTAGEVTLTPSTAAGGTTYTTPVLTVTTAGAAVTGALSATGSITTTAGSFFGVAGTYNLSAGAEGLVFGSATAAILRAPAGTSSLRVGNTDIVSASSSGAAVTGALSATGILSGPGFRASKTTATSGLVKIQDEGANSYNVIASRNNADNAALPLNFQATSFDFNGAVAVTGSLRSGTAISGGSLAISGYDATTQRDWSIRDDAGVNRLRFARGSTDAAFWDVLKVAASDQTGNQIWYTHGAERMQLSSTGLAVTGQIGNSFTGANGQYALSSDNTSSANFHVFYNSASVAIGSINRVTTTNAVSYNTTSDRRIKENVGLLTDSGRLIDSLTPRTFDRKDGSDTDRKGWLGFVAQEVHAADPVFARIGFVTVGDDDPTEITKTWGVSSSPIDALLVAEIQSLRARVAQLEAA